MGSHEDAVRVRRLKDEMAEHILSMKDEEITEVHLLGKKILAHIEGQHFNEDERVTEREKNLILMAVAASYYDLKVAPSRSH